MIINAQIWALGVASNQTTFVTGGIDSKILIWEDCTQEEVEQQKLDDEQRIQEWAPFSYINGANHAVSKTCRRLF